MKSLGEQLHGMHIQKIRSCLHEEKQGFGRESLENYWETLPAFGLPTKLSGCTRP